MIDVKVNFKGKYENLECQGCKIEEESQKHLFECNEIMKKRKKIKKDQEFEEIYVENPRNNTVIARQFLKNIIIIRTLK